MAVCEFRQLSSLAKVFPDIIYGPRYEDEIVCRGESFSLQLAVKARDAERVTLHVSCNSELEARLYRVGYVPSLFPAYPISKCRKYLTKKPGRFPDPLFPMDDGRLEVTSSEWTSVFVTVKVPTGCDAGKRTLLLTVSDETHVLGRLSFSFTVLNATLPEQTLEFTQWFHGDCIANVHGVRVLSEKHWALMERYIRLAGENGISSILTPVFTPPLDTAIGGERTTIQLVDIEKEGDSYRFGFEGLRRFTALVRRAGIKKLEIAHLFTQWGAEFAPKIVVRINGKPKKLFGWKTPAMSPEYRGFLTQFLPALIRELEREGYSKDTVLFHISDEPKEKHLVAYQAAIELVKPLVGEYPIFDALSDLEFYKRGLVEHPVVALSHIGAFLEEGVSGLWGYYCCSQGERVSNRFMAMPAARNRIAGLQFYKYDIKGFLHWGYNFYYTQLSKQKIDPYEVTDAGGAFPSGDAFSVYPYRDGAIPSARLIVFKNAIDDMRLLSLLEGRIGRERTVALVDAACGGELTLQEYPTDGRAFLKLRRAAKRILSEE